jgi:hypothetical protein
LCARLVRDEISKGFSKAGVMGNIEICTSINSAHAPSVSA